MSKKYEYEAARAVTYPLEYIPEKGNVYIYGIGSSGIAFYAWLCKCRPYLKVEGFIDSRQSGEYYDLPVYSLDDFVRTIPVDAYDEVMITSFAYDEIVNSINDKGIKHYRVISPPVYLLANIFHDPNFDKKQYEQLTYEIADVEQDGLHLFFGENLGKFVGNNKYFYLYMLNRFPGKVFWVSKENEMTELLRSHHLPVIDATEENFIRWLLKASYFYFDKMSWPRTFPWLRYFDAKKIHTSHGVGLKYTELMTVPDEFMQQLSSREYKWLYDNVLKNDLLLSTSPFYAKNVSVPGYGTPMERISIAGYPKNDVLYHRIEGEQIFTDEDVVNCVKEKKKDGFKIICYTPTCRHMDANHQDREILDLPLINEFCQSIKAVFVIKGHGLTELPHERISGLSHIFEYNNECDIYPLFRDTDLLITDYSSIYMDFLHVRKPIVFYPYDYEDYMDKHCPLQFDYNQMTPGPKAYDWKDLEKWLTTFLVNDTDKYKLQREDILSLAYTEKKEGASERLYEDMKRMKLLDSY